MPILQHFVNILNAMDCWESPFEFSFNTSFNTLFMVFSVTYNLKLCKAITSHYRFHLLPKKGQISYMDNMQHKCLYLVKSYILSKKLKHYVTSNSK